GPEGQSKPARAAAAGFGKGQNLDPRSGEMNAIGYREPRSVTGQGANSPAPSPLSPYAGLAAAHETEAELDRLRSENAVLSKLLEELKQILEEASGQEQKFQTEVDAIKAREKELLQQVQERDNRVQLLTNQIHELEGHIT